MTAKIFFLTLFCLMFNFSMFGFAQVDSVDVDKFDELRNQGYTIIDVRTAEEFGEGHIESAVLINLHSSDFLDRINSLDKSGRYLVYCRSGRRSAKAVQIMLDAGIREALNLSGGIIAWKNAGKSVVN